ASLSTSQIAAPANRWTGRNRQGWSNPQYDDLAQQLATTLDQDKSNQIRVRIAQLVSEQTPEVMLFWNLNPEVFVSSLKGPVQTALMATGGAAWNVYEWQLQ